MWNLIKGFWNLIKLLKDNPEVVKELVEAHNALVEFIKSNFNAKSTTLEELKEEKVKE